jgi:hypothetical protein
MQMATRPSLDGAPVDQDGHPAIGALDGAPLAGPDDFTAEEIAHLEALSREPVGEGVSSAELLQLIAERAKREEG